MQPQRHILQVSRPFWLESRRGGGGDSRLDPWCRAPPGEAGAGRGWCWLGAASRTSLLGCELLAARFCEGLAGRGRGCRTQWLAPGEWCPLPGLCTALPPPSSGCAHPPPAWLLWGLWLCPCSRRLALSRVRAALCHGFWFPNVHEGTRVTATSPGLYPQGSVAQGPAAP